MKKLFILFLLPVTLQAQSTFTFGSVNSPRQVYPVNGVQQGYMPMGMVPVQQGYIPNQGVPMQRGGGIPIGPIIGLVGGLIQSAVAADRQERMQKEALQRQENYINERYNSYQSSTATPYKKTVTTDNTDYEKPTLLKRDPLLTGIRLTQSTVKSPYSNYTINTSGGATLPGHIATDHTVTPKKNFIIPQEMPFSPSED